MVDTRFCFTHDPSTSIAHARATGRGGMVTKADRIERLYLLSTNKGSKLLKLHKMSTDSSRHSHER
jgi:hypothetical protein